MISSVIQRRTQKTAIALLILVTVAVSPWMNIDPINLPKYFVLTVLSMAILSFLLVDWRGTIQSLDRKLRWILSAFTIALFSSFLFSGSSKVEQLFGTFGRNTGLVTYLCLVILCIAMYAVAELGYIRKVLFTLVSLALVNAVYGFFQFLDMDPINWNNPYNPIVGTLGNPNFISSFLGIALVAALTFSFATSLPVTRRILLAIAIGFVAIVIYKTDSIQGMVILFIGIIYVAYMRFVYFRVGNRANLITLALSLLSGGAVFGGFFNQGPLSKLLFQETGVFRIDYWKAGINMTLNHPIFGVGIDSYGDWYRAERTLEATLRRGPEMTSNSAHNVFLDISSNGGFPLLLSYCALVFITLISAFQLLRRMREFEPVRISLIAVYGCYLLQSLISINQLGLAVWGWVVSGLIIGLNVSEKRIVKNESAKHRRRSPASISASSVIASTIGLAIGLLIATPPIHKDNAYRRALENSDGDKIETLPNGFPKLEHYYTYSLITFSENGYEDKATSVAQLASKEFPRNFKAWEMISKSSKSSPEEKDQALKVLRELDPHNPSLLP